jgi:formylglycine-generating enzyme required for sulfatase activity
VRDLVQTEAPIAANGSPVQAQLIPALSPAIPTAAGNTVGVGVGPSRSDAAAPRLQKVLDQTVALRATDVGQEVRRQFDADLAAARASLGADDLDAAAGHIQRALALDPADPAAIALQQNINRKNIEEQAQLAAQKIFVDRDQAQAQKKGAKIDELLNTAKTNDNGDKGRIALAALDELLALDPSNDQAKNLRNKISRYYLPGAATDAWARSPDEPQHHVTITKPFLMDTTLVTVAQFRIFAQDTKYQTDAQKAGGGIVRGPQQWTYTAGASWMAPSFAQQDDHPVVEISWNDAMAFCQWLGSKEARIYRLPTEAEWEYCCRAGTQTAYPWGDNKEEGRGWANCADATLLANATGSDLAVFAWSDGYVFTSPVAKFKPNAWGLYDMIGNAWEWCGDWYGDYRGIAVDPQGPSTGKSKVLRGGSWESGPRQSRCAYRSKSMPDERSNICGFRIVRQPPPL